MAFGKKKSQDGELSGIAADAGEPGEAIDDALFATAEADAAPADLAGTFAAAEEAPATPSEDAPAPEAPAPAGDALSGGPDLLSMFQTTQIQSDDRAALLDLAGEVEMDDLLEDLQTVAAAMGIRVAR